MDRERQAAGRRINEEARSAAVAVGPQLVRPDVDTADVGQQAAHVEKNCALRSARRRLFRTDQQRGKKRVEGIGSQREPVSFKERLQAYLLLRKQREIRVS